MTLEALIMPLVARSRFEATAEFAHVNRTFVLKVRIVVSAACLQTLV